MPTIGGIVVATGGQATGRRTVKEIIDELSRPINAGDETVRALALDALRAAVRRINRMGDWPWEIQEEEITLVSGTHSYSIQGAIKKPLAMHMLSGTGGIRDEHIEYITYDRFLEMYDLNIPSTSRPTLYTIPNFYELGTIRFWPTPQASAFARFTFYRVTAAPRNENAVLDIPEHVSEAYTAFAWFEFLKRLPNEQRPLDIQIAMREASIAQRELAAFANRPGDRNRQTNVYGIVGGAP